MAGLRVPKPLPGGSYTISADDNAALCRAVGGVPDPSGRAHPAFHYIAGQCAMGVSVAGLLDLCDFDVADGPMIARSLVDLRRDLVVEVPYQVSGEIVSLVRKPSRTFGLVDRLEFRLDLRAPDGVLAVSMTHHWVLPRTKEAGDADR